MHCALDQEVLTFLSDPCAEVHTLTASESNFMLFINIRANLLSVKSVGSRGEAHVEWGKFGASSPNFTPNLLLKS